MTDAEYREQKDRVHRYLKKWIGPAGFGWWMIDCVWKRQKKDDNEVTAAADTSAQWQYRQAVITFYLPMFEEMPDERVERLVVHELSHLLVSGLHNFEDDSMREITEYTTELVAQTLLYVEKMPPPVKMLN